MSHNETDIIYLFRGAGHGGDAIMTLRLAAAIQKKGYRVHCAISSAERQSAVFAAMARQKGLDCDFVDYFGETRTRSRFQLHLNLHRYLSAQKPRVVHLHTGNAYVNPLLAAGLAFSHRGRRIVTLHSIRCLRYTGAAHLKAQDYSERHFGAVIVPSEYTRRTYLKFAQRRWMQWGEEALKVDMPSEEELGGPRPRRKPPVHAIGNLADFAAAQCADGRKVRQELGIADHALVVLFAARFVRSKGPHQVIEAFAQAAACHPKAVLLLAGNEEDKELADHCRKAAVGIKNRVLFLGSRSDVADLMAAADIHVLPTDSESFGLSALEAMAAGVPSITYDIPAMREVIADTGLLCHLNDVPALADGLCRLLKDNALRGQLGAASKARAFSVFSEAAIVDAHLRVYGLAEHRDLRGIRG